jgi:hypothetical protein
MIRSRLKAETEKRFKELVRLRYDYQHEIMKSLEEKENLISKVWHRFEEATTTRDDILRQRQTKQRLIVSLLARITSRRETTTNSMQRGVQIILLHVVEEIHIRFPNMYLLAVNYTYSLERITNSLKENVITSLVYLRKWFLFNNSISCTVLM